MTTSIVQIAYPLHQCNSNKKLSYRRDSARLRSSRHSPLFKVTDIVTNKNHVCRLKVVKMQWH